MDERTGGAQETGRRGRRGKMATPRRVLTGTDGNRKESEVAEHESTEPREPQTEEVPHEADDDVEAHAFRMTSDGDEDAVEAHRKHLP